MQPVKVNINQTLTKAEMFFLQKSIELLHRDTIDTYRLRINNPRTLLREISQVLMLIEQKSVKPHYGEELIKEALHLFGQEKEFEYHSINKSYLMNVLAEKQTDKVYHAANVLYKENSDYATKLYNVIKSEISRLNLLGAYDFHEFDTLNRVIGYFYIELKSSGYAKEYLHNFVRNIFSPQKPLANFDVAFDIIGTLINRVLESFNVYIAVKIPANLDPEKISTAEFTHVKHADIQHLANGTNKAFLTFVEKNQSWAFFTINVECCDFLSAGSISRGILQKKLDLLFMGFSSDKIVINTNCFVVGSNAPKRSKNQYFNYQLDGKFVSDIGVYDSFLKNLDNASSKPIDRVSLAKLQAGLRYLRLGSYSDELESKLLNYWIAIEYLFSSADSSGDKVSRLKEYFTRIHCITYAVRIFQYVHRSVVNLALETEISKYSITDLEYLIDDQTIAEVKAVEEDFPLFYYRINTIKDRFKDHEAIKSELLRHQNNLEKNLLRIYRLRNEIVHSAAKDKNIGDVTSHLRYYLTFIINGFIDFIINSPIDVDHDGKISIDDYFIISKIKMESLVIDKSATIQKLLTFRNPLEYLS